MARDNHHDIYGTSRPAAEKPVEPEGLQTGINERSVRRNWAVTWGVLSLALAVMFALVLHFDRRVALENRPPERLAPGAVEVLPGLATNSMEDVRDAFGVRSEVLTGAAEDAVLTLQEVRTSTLPLFDPGGAMTADVDRVETQLRDALEAPVLLDDNSVPFMMTRLAQQLYRQGEYGAAIRHLRTALEREPGFTQARELLGAALLADLAYGEAERTFVELITRNPYEPSYHNNLALARIRLGKEAAAEQNLQEALSLRPGYRDARVNMGLLQFRRKSYREALRYLTPAAHELTDHAGVQYVLGVSYLETGQHALARTHLENLVRLKPDRADSYFLIARSYALEEKTPKALAWLELGRDHCDREAFAGFLRDPAFDVIRTLEAFDRLSRSLPSGTGTGERLP